MQFNSIRFFEATKSGVEAIIDDPSTFFLKQHIGHITFNVIVLRVCSTFDLLGNVAGDYVRTHGLCATMVSVLINAGFDAATILLRTGLRCIASLRNCHNLRSDLGIRQFRANFQGKTESCDNENLENDNVEKDLDSNSKHGTGAFSEQETNCGANLIKHSNSNGKEGEKSEEFKLRANSGTPITSASNSVINIRFTIISM